MSTSSIKHETNEKNEELLQNHWNWSLIGGVTAAVFIFGGLFSVGRVNSDLQAQELIEMMSPAMQMLAFAAITATGTIIALMLTMLGLIHQSELQFKKEFYASIQRIALLATIGFICSVLLLALTGIPFGEANSMAVIWFDIVYHVLIFANALISGLMITIILMLHDAVRGIIQTLKFE